MTDVQKCSSQKKKMFITKLATTAKSFHHIIEYIIIVYGKERKLNNHYNHYIGEHIITWEILLIHFCENGF